jgi:hypothetical protein
LQAYSICSIYEFCLIVWALEWPIQWSSNGSFQKTSIAPPQRKLEVNPLPPSDILYNTFTIVRNNFVFPPPPDGRNFLRGGSVDLFWNDPINIVAASRILSIHMHSIKTISAPQIAWTIPIKLCNDIISISLCSSFAKVIFFGTNSQYVITVYIL